MSMKRARRLIEDLRRGGVELSARGEVLSFRCPPGAICAEDKALLAELKCEILATLALAEATSRLPPLRRTAAPARLSPAQDLYVTGCRNGAIPKGPGVPIVIELNDAPFEAVQGAMRAIIARHRVLSYCIGAGSLTLLVPSGFRLRFESVAELPFDEQWRLTSSFLERPMDLEGGWLIAGMYLDLGGGAARLLVTVHHVVFDGASADIFRRQLLARLAGAECVDEASLSYLEVANWQHEINASPARGAIVDYWRRWFRQAPIVVSPDTGALLRGCVGGRRLFSLCANGAEFRRLLEPLRSLGVTPLVAIAALVCRAVYRWTGQGRFAVGLITDRRVAPNLADVIGLMVACDALEFDSQVDTSFTATATTLVEDYAFCIAMSPPTPLPDRPEVDLFVEINYLPNLQGADHADARGLLGELELYSIVTPAGEPPAFQTPLKVVPFINADRAIFRFEFNDVLFDAATSHALLSDFSAAWSEALAELDEVRAEALSTGTGARQDGGLKEIREVH